MSSDEQASAEAKRVFRMTDAELIRVIRGRGNDLATLTTLKSLTRILDHAAKTQQPQFAPGLRAAIGLIEVYSLNFAPGHEDNPFKGCQASVAKCFASIMTGDAVDRRVEPKKTMLVVDMETHSAMPLAPMVVKGTVLTPDQMKMQYAGKGTWQSPPILMTQNVPRTGTGKPRKAAFATRTRGGKPSKASLAREAMETMPGPFRVQDLLTCLKAQGNDVADDTVKMALHDSYNRRHIRRVSWGSYEVVRMVKGEHTAAKPPSDNREGISNEPVDP